MIVGRFPRLWHEDNLSGFPLCREVPFEIDCIEQLCKILYSDAEQSLRILQMMRSYPGDFLGFRLSMIS
jgi:hypothetical protein